MMSGWGRWSIPLLALLAGCVASIARPVSDNNAVLALVTQAQAEREAGRTVNAASALDRALRIEPRNAALWHERAQLAWQMGDPAQAEQLAARSSTLAGHDAALRARNWELIAQARAARGDEAGASAARQRAQE